VAILEKNKKFFPCQNQLNYSNCTDCTIFLFVAYILELVKQDQILFEKRILFTARHLNETIKTLIEIGSHQGSGPLKIPQKKHADDTDTKDFRRSIHKKSVQIR